MKIELTLEDPYARCIEVTINKFGLTIANIEGLEQLPWPRPVTIHHSMYDGIRPTGIGEGNNFETHLVNGIIVYGQMEYDFIQACIPIQISMFT